MTVAQIVSTATENYAAHYCALLHSAWLFQPRARYHLFSAGITVETRQSLSTFARRRGLSLDIVEIDTDRLDGVQIWYGADISTYARLLTPELLPGVAGRVLYLDADTTITAPLDEVFASDLDGSPLAAVPDIRQVADFEIAQLGLPAGATYCNAGVMLLDVDRWRAENLSRRLIDIARDGSRKLHLMDQSAINFVLAGRIRLLGKEWNFFDPDTAGSIGTPRIIHYAGLEKPWFRAGSPYRPLYAFHRNNTPWKLPEIEADASPAATDVRADYVETLGRLIVRPCLARARAARRRTELARQVAKMRAGATGLLA